VFVFFNDVVVGGDKEQQWKMCVKEVQKNPNDSPPKTTTTTSIIQTTDIGSKINSESQWHHPIGMRQRAFWLKLNSFLHETTILETLKMSTK
jgi:hypothetical protein